MQTRMLSTLAILLVAASPAVAQQTAPAESKTTGAITGVVDVGALGTSASGDEARYERYADLRNGVFSHLVFGQADTARLWSASADHVGYRDQQYLFRLVSGGTTIKGSWNSIPLNYSYLTATPWRETSQGVFALDSAARAAVQGKLAGVVGVPQNALQLDTPSIFRGLATPFDLRSRRDVASGGVAMDATRDIGWQLSFTSTRKSGQQPYGASFSFNNANELPIPIDNRTNDLSAGLEWTRPEGMIRVGWDASWFSNAVHEIIWDNPLRATDTTPFDVSGYSNGNGPARGRMSMPPSNHMNTVSTTGLYKMPGRTTLSGVFSFTDMGQNDTLIPWTTNGAIANAGVYAAFPALASLPRATAEARVQGVNAMMNLTSRPNSVLGLTMRYRFNDHRNLTPAFDAREYVRFDAVPEETGGITEQFNIRQNTFDMTGSFNLRKSTTLRVGYTYDDFNRTGRAYGDMRDYTVRTSLDQFGNRFVTLRLSADHTTRVGSGFSEASLEDGGLQPGLRFYDEADRSRDRGTALVVLSPAGFMDVTFQATAGKDVYKGEGHEFGLLDNTNQTYNVGVNISPGEKVAFGATVGRETFNALQRSRNANPPGTDYGSWTDANRTWDLRNEERVKTVDVYLDLAKLARHLDLRADYIFSDSDNGFVFSGPRIVELSTNTALTAGDTRPCAAGLTSCFSQMSAVTNAWHRVSLDAKHYFTAKVGVGVGYWFERFTVTDFATVNLPGSETPRIDYLGELGTGYGNRPYRGQSVFVRLLYRF